MFGSCGSSDGTIGVCAVRTSACQTVYLHSAAGEWKGRWRWRPKLAEGVSLSVAALIPTDSETTRRRIKTKLPTGPAPPLSCRGTLSQLLEGYMRNESSYCYVSPVAQSAPNIQSSLPSPLACGATYPTITSFAVDMHPTVAGPPPAYSSAFLSVFFVILLSATHRCKSFLWFVLQLFGIHCLTAATFCPLARWQISALLARLTGYFLFMPLTYATRDGCV